LYTWLETLLKIVRYTMLVFFKFCPVLSWILPRINLNFDQKYSIQVLKLKMGKNLRLYLTDLVFDTKERSCERVDYDQFLPRNGLFGSLQRFLNH
jgi:hypothetical protein